MTYMFDLALLVLSGCSAVYCWTLSRRLNALQDLRKGMGKAMVSWTKSISTVEANAAKLNREAAVAVSELRDMLARVDASEGKVDVLLETMDKQARETWKDHRGKIESAQGQINEIDVTLRELIGDAKSMASMMNDQLITMAEVMEKQRKDAAAREAAVAAQAAAKRASVVKLPKRTIGRAAPAPQAEAKPAAQAQAAPRAEVKAPAKPVAAAPAGPSRAAENTAPVKVAAATSSVSASKQAESKPVTAGQTPAEILAASKAKQEALARAVARAAGKGREEKPEPLRLDDPVLPTAVPQTAARSGADPRVAALARKLAAQSGDASVQPKTSGSGPSGLPVNNPFAPRTAKTSAG